MVKFPPRNYRSMEYPLPHNFAYQFRLDLEQAAQNSTYVSLIQNYEGMNAADTIEVNPSNAAFLEETGARCQPDSIIPKMNISIRAQFKHATDESDNLRFAIFNWMPVYLSFLDNYTAMDNKADVEIEDILELQHTVANKDCTPLFGTKLQLISAATHPVNTVNMTGTFTTEDLTTNVNPEAVAFDEELFWDAMQYYSNAPMLRSVIGKWHTEILHAEHPFIMNSNNFTNPKVKRVNEYTYCGILFHVPQIGTAKQFYEAADSTAASGIDFRVQVRYDEWNSQFDQTAF